MIGRGRVALVSALAVLGATVACASDTEDAREPTTTTVEVTTPSPPTTPTTSAEQALAAGLCPAVAPTAQPDPDRPSYRAQLAVDPSAGTVRGPMTVEFTPDLVVDRLVLRLWPNGPRPGASGATEVVAGVTVDGRAVEVSQPDPTTVVVPLAEPSPAGDTIELALDVDLAVPGSARDRVSRNGEAMRLGSFLPLLPWEPGVGWAEEPPTTLFAEATTSPTADFEVALSVPEGYDVLATGVPDGAGVWRAEAVRDFAVSIGHFDLATATVDLARPVQVTVGVDRSVGEDPQAYLDRVVASLEQFSHRFGPYPWPVLTLAVTPGLGGGIEFPTHIMQGPDTVGRTTPHEVGHMWFYSLVGNNQGRDPWLDEGLASYAEATFEDTLEQFRGYPIPASAVGAVGEPLTFWEGVDPDDYYPGVYIQGAVAVADLGPPEMVDCALRHYVAEQAHAIARPADLLAELTSVFPDAPTRLAATGLTD